MTDDRMNPDLITDIFSVLDRHGYARGDDAHTARAIVLIGDLAHIYQGSLDHPFGPCSGEIPPRTEPEPLTPAGQDAVLVPAGEVKNLLAALDIAADCERDRAELGADCTNQSCPACESRLRDAHAYDHLSAQLIQAAEASSAARRPEPGPAADREAGQ